MLGCGGEGAIEDAARGGGAEGGGEVLRVEGEQRSREEGAEQRPHETEDLRVAELVRVRVRVRVRVSASPNWLEEIGARWDPTAYYWLLTTDY
eukprot:scaffold57247_cov39-Phaeocystis_antarctica.AAC.1